MTYLDELKAYLVGRTVTDIEALDEGTTNDLGWWGDTPAILITFDDGTKILPQADPEGNGAGWLHLLPRFERCEAADGAIRCGLEAGHEGEHFGVGEDGARNGDFHTWEG